MTRSNTLPGRISRATFPSTGTSSHFQPPPYTWILAAIFQVFDGWYLLVARVVLWALAFASCVLLFSLLRSLGTGSVVAFVLVLAFVTSPFTHGPLVETRNDIMPLFYLLVALRLYVDSDGGISRGKHRLLWSGFFFSIAAATKYSYFFAPPISVVVLLFRSGCVRQEGAVYRPAHPMVRSRRFGRHASARICAGHSPGAFRLHDTALSYDGKLRLVSLARFGRDADIGA